MGVKLNSTHEYRLTVSALNSETSLIPLRTGRWSWTQARGVPVRQPPACAPQCPWRGGPPPAGWCLSPHPWCWRQSPCPWCRSSLSQSVGVGEEEQTNQHILDLISNRFSLEGCGNIQSPCSVRTAYMLSLISAVLSNYSATVSLNSILISQNYERLRRPSKFRLWGNEENWRSRCKKLMAERCQSWSRRSASESDDFPEVAFTAWRPRSRWSCSKAGISSRKNTRMSGSHGTRAGGRVGGVGLAVKAGRLLWCRSSLISTAWGRGGRYKIYMDSTKVWS